MKVYIAGPITNDPDYMAKFQAAEERLLAEGYQVVNPAKNQGYSYKEYIDIGLFELMHCDAIYLLNGYETSKGAGVEYHYALVTDMIMMYEPAAVQKGIGEQNG